jgi:hypothetical protein
MSLFEAELALAAGRSHTLPLDACEIQFLEFRKAQLANDAQAAQQHLTQALELSRQAETRDHLLEARIRMEWGLVRASLGEHEQAGVDLKWAMDRLEALEAGHRYHGLAIINLARWHESRDEQGMALALYSSISRQGPHLVEIIALSRYHAANLWFEKGHGAAALRHYWVAHHGFKQTELTEQAVDAGLQWLDLALADVDADAQTMDEAVELAAPRSQGESHPKMMAHPDDVQQMVDYLRDKVADGPGLLVLEDAAQTGQS